MATCKCGHSIEDHPWKANRACNHMLKPHHSCPCMKFVEAVLSPDMVMANRRTPQRRPARTPVLIRGGVVIGEVTPKKA